MSSKHSRSPFNTGSTIKPRRVSPFVPRQPLVVMSDQLPDACPDCHSTALGWTPEGDLQCLCGCIVYVIRVKEAQHGR